MAEQQPKEMREIGEEELLDWDVLIIPDPPDLPSEVIEVQVVKTSAKGILEIGGKRLLSAEEL